MRGEGGRGREEGREASNVLAAHTRLWKKLGRGRERGRGRGGAGTGGKKYVLMCPSLTHESDAQQSCTYTASHVFNYTRSHS